MEKKFLSHECYKKEKKKKEIVSKGRNISYESSWKILKAKILSSGRGRSRWPAAGEAESSKLKHPRAISPAVSLKTIQSIAKHGR